MSFNNYDVHKTHVIESDIFDSTQKILYDVSRKHDNLCSSLSADLGSINNTSVQSDIDVLRTEVNNHKRWIEHVVKLNKHLLSLYDIDAYSYMNEPYKDDYGTVYDNVSFSKETNLNYNQNHKSAGSNQLLEIDKQGNIWIEGIIENNSVKIGNKIKKLAEDYKHNVPLETIDDINF